MPWCSSRTQNDTDLRLNDKLTTILSNDNVDGLFSHCGIDKGIPSWCTMLLFDFLTCKMWKAQCVNGSCEMRRWSYTFRWGFMHTKVTHMNVYMICISSLLYGNIYTLWYLTVSKKKRKNILLKIRQTKCLGPERKTNTGDESLARLHSLPTHDKSVHNCWYMYVYIQRDVNLFRK